MGGGGGGGGGDGVLYLEGRFNRGFWVTVLGGLYLDGLIHGGAYFRNFGVYRKRPIPLVNLFANKFNYF